MTKRLLRWLGLLGLAYGVLPYLTLVQLLGAIERGDTPYVEQRVDLESLEASLVTQIEQRLSPEADAPGAATRRLARSFAHELVAAEGVAGLIRSRGALPPLEATAVRATSAPGSGPGVPGIAPFRAHLDDLEWLFFTGARHFEARARGATLVMELGWAGWQIVDLRLPEVPALR